jgi:acyl carrier protein
MSLPESRMNSPAENIEPRMRRNPPFLGRESTIAAAARLSNSFLPIHGAIMSSSTVNADVLEPRVRAVLAQHARLSGDATSMDTQADLYQAGMTSHASVNVMLALEGEFDVEFPDEMLNRSAFSSIRAICQAVASIGGQA